MYNDCYMDSIAISLGNKLQSISGLCDAAAAYLTVALDDGSKYNDFLASY